MLILFFLALTCWPVSSAAQEQALRGESTISGRVIFADTGRPVRRATVRLYASLNYPPVRVTPANARGEFRFNEVAAGSYFVVAASPASASSNALAITEFGLSADTETEHTRVAVDGKGATRCEVRVVRGGTIRGTILYADKEPVMGAQIVLFRRWNGATVPLFTDSTPTNDRGMYRIDGLPDGEYFVGVTDGKRKAALSTIRELRGFVTGYYPGVNSIVEAKPVQIQSGAEVTGINITFGDDELRQISGTVKLRGGAERIASAHLSLRRKEEPRVQVSFENLIRSITDPKGDSDSTMMRDLGLMMISMPPSTEIDGEGTWKFDDLAPGTYVLTAYASLAAKDKDKPVKKEGDALNPDDPLPELDDDRPTVHKQMELTVKDEDLKDIVVEVSEGSRISGSIVADSPLPSVRIAVKHRVAELLQDLPAPAKEDGTFVLEAIPSGEVRLSAHVPVNSDLYVKSITLGSQDLVRNPLRVEEGVEINGVLITLAKGLASVAGRALFSEGGGLAGGSGVLLVNADPALWDLEGSRVFALTNPEGEFTLRCAPGDYLVFTWPAGGQPFQSLEAFIRSQAPAAKRITLQSKEEKQLDLTVVKPKK